MDIMQFVPISVLISDFTRIEELLGLYGEVVIVKDDRPKYRIIAIDDAINSSSHQTYSVPYKANEKGDKTMDVLNKIGKRIFVEHYYDFKNDHFQADDLSEDFTTNSKRTRTSRARKIFRDGLHLEALQIIIDSDKLDQWIIERAKEIYAEEISQM
jgi:hypothetical protein